MTRIVLVLALCLALAPGAGAQDMSGIEVRPTSPVDTDLPNTGVTAAQVRELWTEVSGLSAVQAGQLLDLVSALASAKNADVASLSAHSLDVARHYGVFRDAHAHAAGGQGADVEALYAQVFEGKAAADVPHLGRVAAGYFTLHHNYSQLVNARFLATNATDPSIAEAATARAATYETNVLAAVNQLKGLLAPERR